MGRYSAPQKRKRERKSKSKNKEQDFTSPKNRKNKQSKNGRPSGIGKIVFTSK